MDQNRRVLKYNGNFQQRSYLVLPFLHLLAQFSIAGMETMPIHSQFARPSTPNSKNFSLALNPLQFDRNSCWIDSHPYFLHISNSYSQDGADNCKPKSRSLAAWQQFRTSNPLLLSRIYGIPTRRRSVFSSLIRSEGSEKEKGARNLSQDCRKVAALNAIAEALTPALHPHKQGQSELALRMAKFRGALASSVQNNEIVHCDAEVRSRIQSMATRNRAAQASLSWIDETEAKLKLVPSESDVLKLQMCFQQLGDVGSGSKEEKLIGMLKRVEKLERNLQQMPSAGEIRRMGLQKSEVMHELTVSRRVAGAAVKKLRQALCMAEIAWLKNVEDSSAKLLDLTENLRSKKKPLS